MMPVTRAAPSPMAKLRLRRRLFLRRMLRLAPRLTARRAPRLAPRRRCATRNCFDLSRTLAREVSVTSGVNTGPLEWLARGARSGTLAAQLGPIASDTNIANAPMNVRSFMQCPFMLVSKIAPQARAYNAAVSLSGYFLTPLSHTGSRTAQTAATTHHARLRRIFTRWRAVLVFLAAP